MSPTFASLDEVARSLGMTRDELDLALAGLESGPPASNEQAALAEVQRLLTVLDRLSEEGRAKDAEILELRRILHKVVLDNVLLTERVNELALVRLRQRGSAAGLPWYRRWLDRLLARRESPVTPEKVGRRVA